MDWIEQGLTSPPTQYRLSGRQFYRSKDPTNSIKALKEKLASHRPEEAPNPPGASHRVTSGPLKKKNPIIAFNYVYHKDSPATKVMLGRLAYNILAADFPFCTFIENYENLWTLSYCNNK